jgi:hypothetical protein
MKYTVETPLHLFDPHKEAKHLVSIIDRATPLLASLSNADAAKPRTDGHWSAKEIIGHLVDSAGNNLQRVVRLQMQESLLLPGYEQEGWVRVQHYQQRTWSDLLELWTALNRHLAHTIHFADRDALSRCWQHEGEEISLAFIIEDYIAHLQHHLRQIFPDWMMEEKN